MTQEPTERLMLDLVAQMTIFNGDRWYEDPTREQLKKFFALLNEAGITYRPLRLAMLRVWSGCKTIKSTNDLTKYILSTMINLICLPKEKGGGLSIRGLIFLTQLADYTEANFTLDEGDDNRVRVGANLSIMQ